MVNFIKWEMLKLKSTGPQYKISTNMCKGKEGRRVARDQKARNAAGS
jgi:hypothetical protein